MKKQYQIIIAALVIACVLAVVFVVTWAAGAAHERTGPRALAQDNFGNIWTQTSDALYAFNSDGKVLRRHTPAEIGIPNVLGPICPLGNGEMLVGSRSPNLIYWLDTNGKVTRTLDPGQTPSGPIRGAYHLAFDANASTIYVTDSSNHRVLVFDGQGTYLRREGPGGPQPGTFHFPNGVKLFQDQVWIADTNHHELAVMGKDLRPIQRIKIPVGKNGTNRWPVLFDRDTSNNLYVIQSGERLKKGEVDKYDAHGGHMILFPTSVDPEPQDVLVLGETLLISGGENFDIQRFSLDGRALGRFGDSGFVSEMNANRSRHKTLLMISTYAPLVLAGLLLFGCAAYMREIRQKSGGLIATAALPIAARIDLSSRAMVLLTLSLIRSFSFPAILISSYVAVRSLVGALMRGRVADLALEHSAFLIGIVFLAVVGEWLYLKIVQGGFMDPLREASRQAFLARFSPLITKDFLPGEKIVLLGNGQEGKMLWPQYYVLTSARLLILDLDMFGTSARRVKERPLAYLKNVVVKPLKFDFRRWLHGLPPASELIFQLYDQQHVLYFSSDRAAETFAGAVKYMPADRDLQYEASLHKLAIDPSGDPGDAGRFYAGNPSIGASVAASLLLPGLGQILQRRFVVGIIYMAVFGLLVVQATSPIMTYLLRTAEVRFPAVLYALFLLVFLWLLNIWDAYSFAKKF